MQISFSAEKALIEKIDVAAEKFRMSRSSFIAKLLKWAVQQSPLIREGKMFEAVEPNLENRMYDLEQRVQKLEQLGVKVTFISEKDEKKVKMLLGKEAEK